jgi:hypothetical protein
MRPVRFLHGTTSQGDTPDWAALEALLAFQLCAHFMWMFDVELEDGTRLDAYKHKWTRRYFHLAGDGRAFLYAGDHRYREIHPHAAILEAFETWEGCEPTAEEEAALQAALRKARGSATRARRRRREGS